MVPSPPTSKTSPERRVLHERSQSQTNQANRRSYNTDKGQESFLASPYPTKPAHVLLPSSIKTRDGGSPFLESAQQSWSGKGKGKGRAEGRGKSRDVGSHGNRLAAKRSVSELRNLYEKQSSSRPASGQSSRPRSRPSTARSNQRLRGGFAASTRASERGTPTSPSSEASFPLPSRPTSFSIKKIGSEASLFAPQLSTPDRSSHNFDVDFDQLTNLSGSDPISPTNASVEAENSPTITSGSHPILLPTTPSKSRGYAQVSSSPNFLVLGHSSSQDLKPGQQPEITSSPPPKNVGSSSSPNIVTLGSSSPNYVITRFEESMDDSPTDSLRTIKKGQSDDLHQQSSVSSFSTSTERFSSSPPEVEESFTSASAVDLSTASESEPGTPVPYPEKLYQAHRQLQSQIESSPAPEIQYPVVRAPIFNPKQNLSVPKRSSQQSQEERGSPRNSCSSIEPARWSQTNRYSAAHTLEDDGEEDLSSIIDVPEPAYVMDSSANSSTTSVIIRESDHLEASDIISDLRSPYLHHKTSGLLSVLSTSSRSNSLTSFILRRASSNGSLRSTVRFPAWACRYYSVGPTESFIFLRPETPKSNDSPPLALVRIPSTHPSNPTLLFQPRNRSGKNAKESHKSPGIGPLVSNPSHRLSSLPLHPADPRAHWAGAQDHGPEGRLNHPNHARNAMDWSPHLYPSMRVPAHGQDAWTAPSIDSSQSPAFSCRNAHMLGFLLGFVFPPAWFVGAFLPLPPKPMNREMAELENGLHDEQGGTLQEQLDQRTRYRQEARYLNLRWWRNLNRFMCVVGLLVMTVIICLAVIGTRGGFSP